MSTRATYLFTSSDIFTPSVCFYIHHDGYLAGAAAYLAPVVGAARSAETFVRSNARAEFTRCHESHGDTEYRYTIHDGELTAYARHISGEKRNWNIVFQGPLADFVEIYSE